MTAAEVLALDGLAQAERIREGAVTAVELVDAAISRIEALNPTLNCVVIERFAQASWLSVPQVTIARTWTPRLTIRRLMIRPA